MGRPKGSKNKSKAIQYFGVDVNKPMPAPLGVKNLDPKILVKLKPSKGMLRACRLLGLDFVGYWLRVNKEQKCNIQ